MTPTPNVRGAAAAFLILGLLLRAPAVLADGGAPAGLVDGGAPATVQLAQDDGTRQRELEPRYTTAPVEEPSSYNSSYIFGMTRGVAESTIHPAGKVPLFVLTVPLDLLFLPFAAIGGLFG
jgi:hypothetical protein